MSGKIAPPLVETAFTFQVPPVSLGDKRRLLVVRTSLVNGELHVTFDLSSGGEVIEGLAPAILEIIGAAVNVMRGKISALDLVEEEH